MSTPDPELLEHRRMFAFDQAKRFVPGGDLEKTLEAAARIEAYLSGGQVVLGPSALEIAEAAVAAGLIMPNGEIPPARNRRRRLPDGERCKCMHLYIATDGTAWCCQG